MTTGTQLTINIRDLGIPFEAGKSYRIDIDQGLTKEVGNNRSPSEPRPNFITFNTITQAIIVSTIPANGSSTFTDPENASATFDRLVYKNSGSIYVYKQDNTLIRSISVEDSDVALPSNSSTVTLNLLGDLNRKTGYYILFDGSAFNDNFFINAATVTNTTTWYFETGEGPVVNSVSPSYGTTGSYVTTGVLNYNDQITEGTSIKNFYIFKETVGGDQLVSTIPNDSNRITYSNNSVQIDLKGIVDSETTYYLKSEVGTVIGSNLFDSEPILDNSVFKYSTGIGPKVISVFPLNTATNVKFTATIARFDLPIELYTNTNKINVYKLSDQSLVGSVNANDSRVSITGTDYLNVNLRSIIDGEETYYVNIDKGVVRNTEIKFGNKSVNDTSTIKISTGLRPYPQILNTSTLINSTLASYTANYYDDIGPVTIDPNPALTGYFRLYETTGTTSTFVSTASVFIPVSGTIAQARLKGLIDGGKYYYLTLDDKVAIARNTGFTSKGWTDSEFLKFNTGPRPVVVSTSSMNMSTTTVNVSFDQGSVEFNPNNSSTKKFYLYETTSGTPVLSSVISPNNRATIANGQVRFDLRTLINRDRSYSIITDADQTPVWNVSNGFTVVPFTGTNSISFTTDQGPILINRTPVYNSLGIDTSTITLTYNYSIQSSNEGNWYLYQGNASSNTLVETIAMTNTSVVSRLGQNVRLNLHGKLIQDQDYFITADPDLFSDSRAFTYRGISDPEIVTFNTAGPIPIQFSPSTDSIYTVGENLSITYQRPVYKTGTSGNLKLFKTNTQSEVISFDISTSSISISSSTLTIEEFKDYIEPGINYYITADSGLVNDINGFLWYGISNTSTWKFTASYDVTYQGEFRAEFAGITSQNPLRIERWDDNSFLVDAGFLNTSTVSRIYSNTGTIISELTVRGITNDQYLLSLGEYISLYSKTNLTSPIWSVYTTPYIINYNGTNYTYSSNSKTIMNNQYIVASYLYLGNVVPAVVRVYDVLTGNTITDVALPSGETGEWSFGTILALSDNYLAVVLGDSDKIIVYDTFNWSHLYTVSVTSSGSIRDIDINDQYLVLSKTEGVEIRSIVDGTLIKTESYGSRNVTVYENLAFIGVTDGLSPDEYVAIYDLETLKVIETVANPRPDNFGQGDEFGGHIAVNKNGIAVGALNEGPQFGSLYGATYFYTVNRGSKT